jgi:hypothetical protein
MFPVGVFGSLKECHRVFLDRVVDLSFHDDDIRQKMNLGFVPVDALKSTYAHRHISRGR